MNKWKFNDKEIEQNPLQFEEHPIKESKLKKTVSGNYVFDSSKNKLNYFEEFSATWRGASINIRNFLRNAFYHDSVIRITTHIGAEYDAYIDDYSETETQGTRSDGSPPFDLDVTFRAIRSDSNG